MDKQTGLKQLNQIEERQAELRSNCSLLESSKAKTKLICFILGAIAVACGLATAGFFMHSLFDIYSIVCAVTTISCVLPMAYEINKIKKLNMQITSLQQQIAQSEKDKQHVLDNIDLPFEDSYSITISAKPQTTYVQNTQTNLSGYQPE